MNLRLKNLTVREAVVASLAAFLVVMAVFFASPSSAEIEAQVEQDEQGNITQISCPQGFIPVWDVYYQKYVCVLASCGGGNYDDCAGGD